MQNLTRLLVTALTILLLLAVLAILFGGCSLTAAEIKVNTYSGDEVDYFTEIAFGAERGQKDPHIRKWTSDVQLQITGAATAEDSAVVLSVVDEINALIQEIQVQIVTEAPTAEVRFVSQEELDARTGGPCHCFGLAVTEYDQRRVIRRADVLILTTMSPQRRAHAIREEITQMLGLMVDSNTYPDSIFYQPPSEVTTYAEIDRRLIEMLYRPEIRPGMTREEAVQALGGLYQ